MKGQIQSREDIKEWGAMQRGHWDLVKTLTEEPGHDRKGGVELLMKAWCWAEKNVPR